MDFSLGVLYLSDTSPRFLASMCVDGARVIDSVLGLEWEEKIGEYFRCSKRLHTKLLQRIVADIIGFTGTAIGKGWHYLIPYLLHSAKGRLSRHV